MTTPTTAARDLASNMIGLLTSGPAAPLPRILHDGLTSAIVARGLLDELEDKLARSKEMAMSRDHVEQDIARLVAAYASYVLREAVKSAQDAMAAAD